MSKKNRNRDSGPTVAVIEGDGKSDAEVLPTNGEAEAIASITPGNVAADNAAVPAEEARPRKKHDLGPIMVEKYQTVNHENGSPIDVPMPMNDGLPFTTIEAADAYVDANIAGGSRYRIIRVRSDFMVEEEVVKKLKRK